MLSRKTSQNDVDWAVILFVEFNLKKLQYYMNFKKNVNVKCYSTNILYAYSFYIINICSCFNENNIEYLKSLNKKWALKIKIEIRNIFHTTCFTFFDKIYCFTFLLHFVQECRLLAWVEKLVLYNIFIAIVNLPQNYFIHALTLHKRA